MNVLKLLKILFITPALLLSFLANAENELVMGEGVNLIAVNGKEVSSDSFFSGKEKINLHNGVNQILVNYTAEIKNGSETELEHSNTFVILFKGKNERFTLSAPRIKKLSDIKKFESEKNWNLIDSQGNKFNFRSDIIKHSGFQLSRNYEAELKAFNKTNSPAALPEKNPIKINKNNKSKNAESEENIASQMLIYWYNQADDKTREEFKKLINSN